MKETILSIILGFLIWLFVLVLCDLNELKDLNSKIDKIVAFLDLELKDEIE